MSAGGGSGAATAVVEITVVDRSGDRLALDVALDGEAAATPRALFEMVADAIDAPTTSFKLWYAHAGATWRLHNAVKLPALIRDKGVNMFYLSDADQTAFQIQDRDANITSKAQKPAQPPMSKAVRVKLLVDGKLQKNYRIMATEADFSKERFVFRCAKELGLGDVASMRVTVVDPADNQTYEIPGNDIGEEISSGFCFQFERNTTVHDHASEGSWDAAGPTADALDETTLQILQGEEDPTWICYEGQRRHEFFFSHRQVSEAGLIEGLYNALAEYGHQAYWDRVCIRPGKAFRTEFLRGLSSSRFAALFISEFTLTQIRTAHQRQDNVLLEVHLFSPTIRGSNRCLNCSGSLLWSCTVSERSKFFQFLSGKKSRLKLIGAE
ncbi:hypothetical protein DFJ73DRAFT_151111 [Zopfochytrium polystomum]|nr:hypothetical protein DFJ73DRAFT_151111 [Zopfochytrium polystomum]